MSNDFIHNSKHGSASVTLIEAQKIAQSLAADSAQPFLFENSCSHRTELMVGRMIEMGITPSAIARIYQATPQSSVDMMRTTPNGQDRGDFYRLMGVSPATKSGSFPVPGAEHLSVTFGSGNAILRDQDGDKGWDLGDGTKGYSLNPHNKVNGWKNHITAGIYVQDPITGQDRLMVIDPHLTKGAELLTPQQWKEMQNCDSAVVMAGRTGERAAVLPECLTDDQRQKYNSIRTEGLSERQKNNAIAKEMFGLVANAEAEQFRSLSNINQAMFSTLPEIKTLSPKDEKGDQISTDWNSLDKKGQSALCKKWEKSLSPLRQLQDAWQMSFPSITTAPATRISQSQPPDNQQPTVISRIKNQLSPTPR